MKRENYVDAARDLNTVLDPDPPIDVSKALEDLKSAIKEAIPELAEGDELEENTKKVIAELTGAPKEEPKTKATKEKSAKKSDSAEKPAKKSGVIAALIDDLKSGGGTVNEMYDRLAKKFPDRATSEKGMRITIGVQLNRLSKNGLKIHKEKVEGRGTVYSAAA